MSIIGRFRNTRPEYFTGTIQTLTLNIKAELIPVDLTSSDNRPNYRLATVPGAVEIGCAWLKQNESGNTYLSVLIDDPSFAGPVYANLVARESGVHELIWSRRRS